ncbi:NAD(+) diphosphatase [Ciceribacter sp. L1K23]|uniref:NAD(+) diphosphatase n=1 Tax=Ciceribacter sp. L1K23 TaxID=2820276 RepID=UPI001B824217|nr:NAD(+) diphosphatase [Ciceribacter sp. L1K23]MBR0557538.1 NAD(+) diphosphatase [Ciceribacter sp. L1K23]
MIKSLFATDAPHPEPSDLTAFARNGLQRQSEHREDDCLEKALKVDGAHILALSGSHLVLKHENQVLDPLFSPYELADLSPDFSNAVLLGFQPTGEPRLAVPVGQPAEHLAHQYKTADARTLYRDDLLGDDLLGEAAQALSLVHWNRDNQFCGRCGGKMRSAIGGYKRVCVACENAIFPRTDPVVIMLAVSEKQDRCLLGRNHRFPEGMYSCLAGFMEPGETIENAVRRETLEESGIEIGRVRYHASQPWPMPHQLMIGCFAEALTESVVLDPAELADCRWFDRDEVAAMLSARSETRTAPLKGAIANRLMADWLDWQ